MTRTRQHRTTLILAATGALALAAAGQSALAATPGDSATTETISAESPTHLMDPVIEEPIRPLFPEINPSNVSRTASCGSMSLGMMTGTLTILGLTSISGRRHAQGSPPPTWR